MEDWTRSANHSTHADISAAQAIGQEAYVFSTGIGCGIGEVIQRDPLRAAEELGASAVSGAAVGLLVAAELPLISPAAIAMGAYCTGKFLADELNPYTEHNKVRNLAIADAFKTAATTRDQRALQYRIDELSSKCSPDSFALLQATTALAGTRLGAEIPNLSRSLHWDGSLKLSPFTVQGFVPRFEDTNAFENLVDFNKKLNGPVRTTRLSDALIDMIKQPSEAITAEKPTKILQEPRGGDQSRPSFYFSERAEKYFRKN